ncbi:hypothetical protein NGRA_0435 [Nosema granulosis]|uniref:SEP domain-containing protein n=1 Tax=Nosema granulosis TaxID=83296 RepID=A0A9P6H310_9MICR|nr:hypothetical protein NGRA_0435 [Nosema granulosis]
MDSKKRIRKIIERTNCTYDQAVEADKACGGNVEEAISILNKKGNELYVGGGSSGLAVDSGPKKDTIVGYKNGLLVNNKFYDYSDPNNLRLKEMLKNNEFDREILEHNSENDEAEVIYKDATNETYKEETKKETPRKTYENNKKHSLNFEEDLKIDCPDELILSEEKDVIFKVMIGNKRVTVKMSNSNSVQDFYREMKKYSQKEVILVKRGTPVDDKSVAMDLKNSMFMLYERK